MNVWDEAIHAYGKEIQNLKNILGDGGAEDYSNYQNIVGTIKGIEWSRQTLVEMVKRLHTENEED
tara:strand:- start:2758 stop:2952 length:195 start_codon:yes stop_codon:yes gene_type:complete